MINMVINYSQYPTEDNKYECRTGPFEGFFISSVEFCKFKFDDKDRKDNQTGTQGPAGPARSRRSSRSRRGPEGPVGPAGPVGADRTDGTQRPTRRTWSARYTRS